MSAVATWAGYRGSGRRCCWERSAKSETNPLLPDLRRPKVCITIKTKIKTKIKNELCNKSMTSKTEQKKSHCHHFNRNILKFILNGPTPGFAGGDTSRVLQQRMAPSLQVPHTNEAKLAHPISVFFAAMALLLHRLVSKTGPLKPSRRRLLPKRGKRRGYQQSRQNSKYV